MDKGKIKKEKRIRRHNRIRSKVKGTAKIPRLSIFKSNTALYAQLIDDEKGKTLISGNTKKMKGKASVESAKKLGLEIAKQAEAEKIKKVVFDRGGYIYIGKIKAVADGAREGGLKF